MTSEALNVSDAPEVLAPDHASFAARNKLTGKQLKAFQAQVAKIDAQRTEQAKQQLIAERPDAAPLDCSAPAGCEN